MLIIQVLHTYIMLIIQVGIDFDSLINWPDKTGSEIKMIQNLGIGSKSVFGTILIHVHPTSTMMFPFDPTHIICDKLNMMYFTGFLEQKT